MNEGSREEGQIVPLPDGRQLGYLIVGEGKPVFYFHGSPGSRLEVKNLEEIVSFKNFQIIGVDRPGFGLSTFATSQRISDFASDVCFLADYLEVKKFKVVGFSGGGPHSIICAALYPQRVERSIAVSSPASPIDTSGMAFINKIGWKLGTMPIIGEWIERNFDRKPFLDWNRNPEAFLKSNMGKSLLKDAGDEKRLLVYIRAIVEGYRQGSDSVEAMIQETKLMKKGWNVDLSQIPDGLVSIWHGTADRIIPVGNAYKNAEAIPGAHLEIFKDVGHLFFLNNLEKLSKVLNS